MPDYYESDRGVAEYLLFHFGSTAQTFDFDEFRFPEFTRYPVRCIEQCFDPERLIVRDGYPSRALDLGCAVGASSFELARFHDEVLGIDYSHAFVDAARKMAEMGSLRFRIPLEGMQSREIEATLPENIDISRVRFTQGDATQLPDDLGKFDTVFAGNLIDRVPDPRAFLESLSRLTNPGAQVIITSPYTWLEEYTPREKWLQSGDRDTFESIRAILEPEFACSTQLNIPFILREHRRKFQLTLAHASTWVKVSSGN